MIDNLNTSKGGNPDEFFPKNGKKVWVTPQITVQSITASTHNAAATISDGTGNLLS